MPTQTAAFSTMAPTVWHPPIRHPGDTMLSLRPGIPRRAADGLLRLLTQVLLPNPMARSPLLLAAWLHPMTVIFLRTVALPQQPTHPMLALLLRPLLLRPTITAPLASSHPPARVATPGLLMRLQNLCGASQSGCRLWAPAIPKRVRTISGALLK